MATPDLEKPHRTEALRKPQKTPDVEAGMKTSMEDIGQGRAPSSSDHGSMLAVDSRRGMIELDPLSNHLHRPQLPVYP
jgi:hypothetical protein